MLDIVNVDHVDVAVKIKEQEEVEAMQTSL